MAMASKKHVLINPLLLLLMILLCLAVSNWEDALAVIPVGGSGISFQTTPPTKNTSFSDDWMSMIAYAEKSGHGCDDGNPTSIRATLSANDVVVSLSQNRNHRRAATGDDSGFVSIDITFRAYDADDRPQRAGGDLFVVDYRCHWISSSHDAPAAKSNYTVARSAVFSRDGLDGRYGATLLLPRIPSLNVSVSLRHYYTCNEGLQLPGDLLVGGYHSLDFGPLSWRNTSEEVETIMRNLRIDGGTARSSFYAPDVPFCSDGPIDHLLHGAWREDRPDPPTEMNSSLTIDARWSPFHCIMGDLREQPPEIRAASFRIGDSTMPGKIVDSFRHIEGAQSVKAKHLRAAKIKIGIPYTPYLNPAYREQHSQFIDILRVQLHGYDNQTFRTNDSLLYGGGLHHTFHGGFDVPAAVDLVTRSVCQLGLTFPGHIFLRGPNPIQQHLFPKVDQTSLNVRRMNWMLRSRLLRAGGELVNLCLRTRSEAFASFVSIPDSTGRILPDAEAEPILAGVYNYSWERNVAADHKLLVEWMQGLSLEERRRRYGVRAVGWIDLEEVLLPRPEEYRKNDKIHNGPLFSVEWKMLSFIEQHFTL